MIAFFIYFVCVFLCREEREREREREERGEEFRDETLNSYLIFGGGRIFEKKKKIRLRTT